MAKDDSYELTPHGDIVELKRTLQELTSKIEKSSSQDLLNSINSVTRNMDTMLKLFTEASEQVKDEGPDHENMTEKLDHIIEQNKTIADGMVTISDMIKDVTGKKAPQPMPKPIQQPMPKPIQQPQPKLDLPDLNEPSLDTDLPPLEPKLDEPPRPEHTGPVAMPTIPFPSGKPKKKGIFGRLTG